MKAVNPYLNFKGNTEEAFNFYRSIFGGEFPMVMRFSEGPEADKVPDEDKNKIMHIALPLGRQCMLMGTDCVGPMAEGLVMGNNVSLTIHTESKEETDDLFAKLSAGGNPSMPPEMMFWGDYFAVCTDKFGINWMLSYNEKDEYNN